MDVVYSINGVPIRMTTERWWHIVENHDYMAGHYEQVLDTVEAPDLILRGYGGALLAVRGIGKGTYLAVVYKEISRKDGFVISSYMTRKLNRRAIIWRSNS